MATDSLLSLGVVIAGIVISLTGLYIIDPIVSLAIAAVILFNTLRLLRDALRTLFGK
jgi:cobalt-zinc-cadmium efflux system protein